MSPSKIPFGVSANWATAPIDDADITHLLSMLFGELPPTGGEAR